MTILWQGSQMAAYSDIQAGTGGFSDQAGGGWFDPTYSDVGAQVTGTAFLEGDAGAGQTTFCVNALHVYGGGNLLGGNTGQGMNLLDSSKVPWFRLTNPTTSGVYLIEQWSGSVWNTLSTLTLTPASSLWTFNVGGLGTSSGTITVHRGGVLLYAVAGQNFTGIANLRYARFSCLGNDSTRSTWTEQCIANHNLVNNRLKTVRATSNGTDATDGSGSYTDINENGQAFNNDSSYIELTSATQHRSFKAGARTLAFPTSKGCSIGFRAMKMDLTGPQNIKPYLLISGTRYYGTTFALTIGWLNYQYVWTVNPATSSAWTMSDINSAGLEWGLEAVT